MKSILPKKAKQQFLTLEIMKITKRQTWNNKRRYSSSNQLQFI